MAEDIRILHVDDEPEFADLTATCLEREDERFVIESATSAAEGREKLTDEIDCVVSDYEMPGMNGIELLTAVRETYPDLPFILFTGKGSEEVASEAISAGVTDYLRKRSGTEQYELLASRIDTAVGQYRAERELERQRDRLAAVFDAVPHAITEVEFREGEPIVQQVNDAFEETFGYERARVTGESLDDFIVPERDRDGFPLIDYAGNEQLSVEREVERVTADDERRTFLFRSSTITDDDRTRCLGTYTDITARKERERKVRQQREQLQRREEKLIRLRDYTQELMYTETDAETANVALRAIDEILGFELGAVFTHSDTQDGVLELVGVLDRLEMEKMYNGLPVFLRSAPAGTHSALAWEVYETDESVFINDTAQSDKLAWKSPFKSLMVYPIGNHGVVLLAATTMGAFTETEEILLDLLANALETAFDRLDRERELRRQQDELERQNERMDEFVSTVSHDLRNPLAVLKGSLCLAEETNDEEIFEQCYRAVDRMTRMIEDLLELAREGNTIEELESVSLSGISEESWETVATGEATLTTETERVIRADPNRLRQLMENLFRNAIEHSDEPATIRVGDTDGGFYVADDGPGIAEDDRQAVFEMGYSTTEDGTGFGLNIVKRVVDVHDWDIHVAESEDGGTRFEITGVTSGE